MSRSGPRPRLLRMCPTCGGHFPYKRGTKGGRLYLTPGSRPGPSSGVVRVYYPRYGGTWFRCPNPWHEHWRFDNYWGIRNPKQEHSRRTTPARPSTELPGRAEVERRQRGRALRHKARQGKERR